MQQAFRDGTSATVRSLRSGAITDEEADTILRWLLACYLEAYVASMVTRMFEKYARKT